MYEMLYAFLALICNFCQSLIGRVEILAADESDRVMAEPGVVVMWRGKEFQYGRENYLPILFRYVRKWTECEYLCSRLHRGQEYTQQWLTAGEMNAIVRDDSAPDYSQVYGVAPRERQYSEVRWELCPCPRGQVVEEYSPLLPEDYDF